MKEPRVRNCLPRRSSRSTSIRTPPRSNVSASRYRAADQGERGRPRRLGRNWSSRSRSFRRNCRLRCPSPRVSATGITGWRRMDRAMSRYPAKATGSITESTAASCRQPGRTYEVPPVYFGANGHGRGRGPEVVCRGARLSEGAGQWLAAAGCGTRRTMKRRQRAAACAGRMDRLAR